MTDSSACPEALVSPEALVRHVAALPSRATVETWLQAWSMLSLSRAAELELALYAVVSEAGKSGFRAAWVLSLMADRGLLVARDAEDRLMDLLDQAEDHSRQRELLKALLAIQLKPETLLELLDWACQVVFLQNLPAAMCHMAMRVMDKATCQRSALPPGRWPMSQMDEALLEVRQGEHPAHLKKKAALLVARLS